MFTRTAILTFILLMLLCHSADGQYRRRYKMYEIHIGIGAANPFTEIGGASTRENLSGLKDIQFSQTRPTFYLGGRTDINEQVSAKVNLFAGMIAGSDAGSVNAERNYSYKAWLFELSGQLEWNFLRSRASIGSLLRQKRGLRRNQMMTRVYVFGGAGAVYSLPEFNTNGGRLSQGEYTKDNTVGLVLPYGLGVRSDVNSEWALGFEIGRRYCTTNYIEGFTTDWSKAKDLYYFTTFHAIYKIQFVGGRRRAGLGRRR